MSVEATAVVIGGACVGKVVAGPVFSGPISEFYQSNLCALADLSGERYARAQPWVRWLALQPLRDAIRRALQLPCPERLNRRFRVTATTGNSMTIEPSP